ncbi:MAG: 2-oxoacid:acceptor oxidoreductase subunit alpha [Actinobacteria bacterium]|nr:2-oxoacid:acceptor oxidoreductase subunit alpha [Actinomycetota bacterium]
MKKEEITWKIGGEAGYGIMVTGFTMSKIFSRLGYNVFDYPEYPSLIRGGHNSYQVRASVNKVNSPLKNIDVLVALNQDTVDMHFSELNADGILIYDGDLVKEPSHVDDSRGIKSYKIPFEKIAIDVAGGKLMRNTVAIGASLPVYGLQLEKLTDMLREAFAGKAQEIIESNLKAAEAGFKAMQDLLSKEIPFAIRSSNKPKKLIMTGNEAIALGAIRAGCKFYAAYPMTPSSPILHFMAANDRRFGVVVKHTEDEIAAINMAIGAATAGVRSMVATSGGGFSLMVEGLGLAGMTETPVVIVEGQRGAPSTGLPTWTEQGDLRFVLGASQGDFLRVVLAPGDVAQCFYLTAAAFNIAEKVQTPVIVMSDKHVAESHSTVDDIDPGKVKIDSGELLSESDKRLGADFKRYKITKSGISPRPLPSYEGGIYFANSDEHDEKGFSIEDSPTRTAMMDKRLRKFAAALSIAPKPLWHGPQEPDILIVGWGSTRGAILDSISQLKSEGINAAHLQVLSLCPLHADDIKDAISRCKKIACIENNKTGHLKGLIAEKCGINIENFLPKYDGRPFFPDEIVKWVKEVLS